jgi:hypothetical protein
MKMTYEIRQKRTLFSKEVIAIKISEVSPDDAKTLADELRWMFSKHGNDSHYEITIYGSEVNGVSIRGGDRWETRADRDHFIFGFQLAMSMNGIDVTPGG